jgi:hypothetical protein
MNILVCGGREFDNLELLEKILSPFFWQPGKVSWIFGDAKGADFLTRVWLKRMFRRGYAEKYYQEFKADWKKHGPAAGPIRNQQMLDEGKPDLVVAFPGGRGTADMVLRAKLAGVPVIEVQDE